MPSRRPGMRSRALSAMRAIPAKIADNSAVHMPLFALPSVFGILKKFLTHLSWLMVLNLTIKPAYLLVVDAKIQDTLGPEGMGQLSSAAEPEYPVEHLARCRVGQPHHAGHCTTPGRPPRPFPIGLDGQSPVAPHLPCGLARDRLPARIPRHLAALVDMGRASIRPCSVLYFSFGQVCKAQASTWLTHGCPLRTEHCY